VVYKIRLIERGGGSRDIQERVGRWVGGWAVRQKKIEIER
jgi:hypothetical protein